MRIRVYVSLRLVLYRCISEHFPATRANVSFERSGLSTQGIGRQLYLQLNTWRSWKTLSDCVVEDEFIATRRGVRQTTSLLQSQGLGSATWTKFVVELREPRNAA